MVEQLGRWIAEYGDLIIGLGTVYGALYMGKLASRRWTDERKETMAKTIQTLSGTVEDLSGQVKAYQEENEANHNEISQLRADLAAVRTDLTDEVSKRRQLQNENSLLKEDRIADQKKIELLRQEVKRLSEELKGKANK